MRMAVAPLARGSRERRAHTFAVMLIIGMLLVPVQSASAFVNHPWWWSTQPDGTVPITYRWGNNLQTPGTLWRTAFEQARDDWNTRNTKPRWYFYPSTGAVVLNTYSMQDSANGLMEPPQSWYWNQTTNQITRCYLFGNTYYSNSGSRPYLQKRSTAGHEMGHCMGVDHSNVADALMRSGRNREVIFSPWQDDVNAINAKYGPP